MKFKIYSLIVVCLMLLSAYGMKSYQEHLARPVRIDGLYIYVLSEPVGDYEVFGNIEGGIWTAGDVRASASKIAERARKEYPEANAMLFDEVNYRATLIKLKDN